MNFGYVTVNRVNSNDIGENNQRKIIKVNKYTMEAEAYAYRTEI